MPSEPDLLSALPRTRPHRRSAKRPARAAGPAQDEPAKNAAAPPAALRSEQTPKPGPTVGVLGTAVQAAAELAEIGLSVSARALRNAAARFPRP